MTGRPIRANIATATRAGLLLVAVVVTGAVIGVIGIAFDAHGYRARARCGRHGGWSLAASLLVSERQHDERVEEEVDRLSAEHARLSDQLITAEQDERRRLALFLHDGPVQSMSGHRTDAGRGDRRGRRRPRRGGGTHTRPRRSRSSAQTIRSLRDLSFELEPVVLSDQGFGPAVSALADQLGMSNRIQIELDVEEAEAPPSMPR